MCLRVPSFSGLFIFSASEGHAKGGAGGDVRAYIRCQI